MPQYVIEHEIPGAGGMSQEALREASLASIRGLEDLGSEIRWLHSFVTDDKIYCIYFAPDESLIRKHFERLGLPVNRIEKVRWMVDPVNFH